MKTEPESYNVLIPPAPVSVKGLHDNWLLPVSRNLLIWGATEKEANELCYERGLHSALAKGRSEEHWTKEVSDAVKGAIKWLEDNPNARASGNVDPSRYESRFLELEEKIALGSGRIDRKFVNKNEKQFLKLDPAKRELALRRHKHRNVEELVREDISLLDIFCRFDFNVCLGASNNWPIVEPISFWEQRKNHWRSRQFIVPSPMIECGAGVGVRTDANTTKRMYQVIEFDEGTFDEQFRLLLWLGDEWPLAMIVYSGHKSLHGWFPCYHAEERDIRTFFRLATMLGADARMRIPCQFCRLPGGYNQKYKRRQNLVYLDSDLMLDHSWYVKEDVG
jgi:hypothetical protein